LALGFVVVAACKGNGATSERVSAADAGGTASSASTSGSSAPSNAPKLTPARITSFESPPRLLQMTADEAVGEVSKVLGKPTGRDARWVVWAASDGTTCRSYSIGIYEGTLTGASKGSEVKASDFDQQWGKACLIEAGLSPTRRPYTGKTFSVAELRANNPGGKPLRIRGVLSEAEPASTRGASFLLTDETVPTERESCNLELGALSPTAWNGKAVTVECASQENWA
jgi:hypothetical protein